MKPYSFSRLWEGIQVFLAITSVVLVAGILFWESHPWPQHARNYLESQAVEETGAINLVSAIYLGYRAVDTLGETIVLLVAIGGTIGILSQAGASLAKGYGSSGLSLGSGVEEELQPATKRRTVLLNVVAGKLAPIVLVFGFYLMMYGHLSPGGGFQGGVVLASGIIFLSMGSQGAVPSRLTQGKVLARLETVAFLFLVIASLVGLVTGTGLFTNPFPHIQGSNVGFLIVLNGIIGLKVGAGIAFMCLAMLGQGEH